MGRRKATKVRVFIPSEENKKTKKEVPRSIYTRMTKKEYIKHLSKYDDLTKEQIQKIADKAYK